MTKKVTINIAGHNGTHRVTGTLHHVAGVTVVAHRPVTKGSAGLLVEGRKGWTITEARTGRFVRTPSTSKETVDEMLSLAEERCVRFGDVAGAVAKCPTLNPEYNAPVAASCTPEVAIMIDPDGALQRAGLLIVNQGA